MIIKTTRGNDFAGAVDYIARLGVYARKGVARVIAMDGLYDLRTAAAQLTYDAALDPKRSRPVVHLIARAEKGLNDEQYTQLINRMLKAAGLQGHRFVAAVHDDDDHLHVIASEVNEDGAVPPRILWHREEKRVVTADEAKALPRGAVAGRAWDSHLAWRLTRVAREVEVEWNLRRLSSSSKANMPVEPRREHWQKERLARTGMVPLQDRYWNEIRAALALPSWDERAAALAGHALVIRAHEVGGRVRGLQLHSLTDAKDFVKISAFEMGGMAKLDASAGQPFLSWAAQERRTAITLAKPATSQNADMIALQAGFKEHQKDWRRRNGARIGAFRQRRRDTAAIEADIADFADRFRPILTVQGFRQARAEKRRGLRALADARLTQALAAAGPPTPQPVFLDFVKARAGTGDASAARVYRDIAGNVSETRRRSLDRITAMAAELAAAARALGERHERVRVQISVATAALRATASQLARRAAVDTANLKAAMQSAVRDTRSRLASLAERLADRLDAAGYRIRVTDTVHVDPWRPDPVEREIVEAPANRRVFVPYARVQTQQVEALCDDVRRMGSVRRAGETMVFDPARSDIGNPQVLRWANEPEVLGVLYEVERHRRFAEARTERTLAENRQRKAAAALDLIRSTTAAHTAALVAWSVMRAASELREGAAAVRIRVAELAEREAASQKSAAVVKSEPAYKRSQILASLAPTERISGAAAAYFDLWRRAVQAMPADQELGRDAMRSIERSAVSTMIRQGFTEGAIRGIVRERSPMRVGDGVANENRAADILAHVLADPQLRRIRDEKGAEQAERQDRLDTISRLERQKPLVPADRRWIDLWQEILAERPLDTTVIPAERNRAIDHEVAAAMLHEGTTLAQTHSALMRLSPVIRALPSANRLVYVDEQMDALDHVLRRMPADQRQRAGPKPVSAVLLARRWAAHQTARDAWPDDDWASGKLPGLQGAAANVAVGADGTAIINGFEVQFASTESDATRKVQAAPVDAVEPMFDAAGQPLPLARAVLDGIRQHRSAFKLDSAGRLTAPGQTAEHQKLLADLLGDPRFERLALAAYRAPFSGSAHPGIGERIQR